MTGTSFAVRAFDDQSVVGRSALDQVANLVTSPALYSCDDEMLVIAVHPDRNDRRVIASPGYSAVRASISVSVAAGNLRAWSAARGNGIADVSIASLPEIIRAALQPSGFQSVQVAAVQVGDDPACLVMWLSRSATISPEAEARNAETLKNLAEAAARDHIAAADRSVQEEARAQAETLLAPILDMPELDPLETMPTRGDFDKALARLRSDETGLIVFGIDNIDGIAGDHGDEAVEHVRRIVAGRLSSSCRRNDVVARVDDNAFAVLLVDADRRAAFEISKRLRAELLEPIALATGTVSVSISVGLSHETGLVDGVELFVSAESAMEDAHQAGGARMLVAG